VRTREKERKGVQDNCVKSCKVICLDRQCKGEIESKPRKRIEAKKTITEKEGGNVESSKTRKRD